MPIRVGNNKNQKYNSKKGWKVKDECLQKIHINHLWCIHAKQNSVSEMEILFFLMVLLFFVPSWKMLFLQSHKILSEIIIIKWLKREFVMIMLWRLWFVDVQNHVGWLGWWLDKFRSFQKESNQSSPAYCWDIVSRIRYTCILLESDCSSLIIWTILLAVIRLMKFDIHLVISSYDWNFISF